MIDRYFFSKGHLNVGQHKRIDTAVNLQITNVRFDKYDLQAQEDKVEAEGQFSFDSYPITDMKHPIQKHTVGCMSVFDEGLLTKFNIFFLDKVGEQVIVKDRIKRYFWSFGVLGRPIVDKLELFPEWYRTKHMNQVFYCTNFRGFWQTGVSSVVVAPNYEAARKLLIAELKNAGIKQPEVEELTLEQLNLEKTHAVILNDGKY